VIIQPTTDLTLFAGKRVRIDSVRGALVCDIRHRADSMFEELRDGVGGTCIEDPHGDCRGGSTAFWLPYGTDLTVEMAK
jgi:hypothetical protein